MNEIKTKTGEVQTKFLADSMLGKLAKWLRMSGIDTESRNEKRFSAFLRRGRESERIILTKDTKFLKIYSPPPFYFVKGISAEKQFAETAGQFHLAIKSDLLTRCLVCNSILENVERNDVEGLVPDYIFDNFLNFTRCPRCSKLFWEGTHVSNLRKRILEAIDKESRYGDRTTR